MEGTDPVSWLSDTDLEWQSRSCVRSYADAGCEIIRDVSPTEAALTIQGEKKTDGIHFRDQLQEVDRQTCFSEGNWVFSELFGGWLNERLALIWGKCVSIRHGDIEVS